MSSPLRIFVTGGAGFIGSALVRHLIGETDHHVLNVDALTYAGNLASVAPVETSDRYTFARRHLRRRRNGAPDQGLSARRRNPSRRRIARGPLHRWTSRLYPDQSGGNIHPAFRGAGLLARSG